MLWECFGIFRRRKDGRNARCKPCYAAYLRRCYKNNPEVYRAKSNKRRARLYVPAKCGQCGDHHPNGIHPKTLAEKFWSYVKKTKCCWLWTGAKGRSGHATMNIGGRHPKGRLILVHRVSWTLHIGDIEDGKHVLHKCDTPACVRPSHLYLGGQKENARDYHTRGKFKKGCCVP